jgi:cytochrome b561
MNPFFPSTPPRHRPASYAKGQKILHALIGAIVLFIMFPLGLWISFFEPADEQFKLWLYNIHESFGVIIFILCLCLLIARWLWPTPAWPEHMPNNMRRLAQFIHSLMYALMLIMPITGFLATNAWGFPLQLFNHLALPSPIGHDESRAKILSAMHDIGALTLSLCLGLHVLGALYHAIRNDDLARRMY